MKKINFFRSWLMLVMLLVGVGTTWSQETATLTFTAACGGSGTDDKGNSWTVTSDAEESTYDATKGVHYGTSKKAVSYLKLTNSSFTGTISKIVVNASGASGTSAKLDVKVGGSAFGSQQSLTSSNAAYTFSGSATGNIEISLTQTSATKALYVKSVAVTYSTAADTRTAVNMTGFSATKTPLIKGGNTATSVTNDQNGWTPAYTYESSNTNVATVSNDGVITAVAKGTATITASLNIANDDATWKKGATASKTIDITVNNPSHTAQFSVNGSIDESKNQTVEEGSAITFPADPKIDDVVFMGWTKTNNYSNATDAPSDLCKAATMGDADVTYYAVFAVEEEGGTQWKKVAASAVNSAGVYAIITADGHAFNGTISSGHGQVTSTAFSFDSKGVATSAPDGTCEITFAAITGGYTMYNASNGYLYASAASSGKLAWHNTESSYWLYKSSNWLYNSNSAYLRDYQNSSIRTYGANNGSVIQFAKKESSTIYSDYCTTVSLDPKPIIVLSASELAEYAGNTNTSITASISEGAYTGALEVESSAEAVATASISEGTITINALTAGTATITVTAPAVTGFRKNTATIAVTVSNKLAHGLEFSADELNLTVGATEFSEPTLSNPNSLPVVYSLVYATPANEGKVATIDSETGKITLADPSLSTETQGAVTVKASTVGDNSHAAGEVTYNLVVARKVTTTSWSNEGAAVTIDKDEITTLPTASNNGERNLFYESSNTEVAAFVDGVLTFVDYGTTTITARTSATFDYAATSASYELTFAPRYKVTFYINGEETVLREETTGAGVVAPSVEPIEGKVFRGWAEATIDGTTNDAPAFVTTASLDDDKILYAVFATEAGTALDYTMTIGYSGLSTSGYANENKSATATCTTDPSNTLTINYSTTDVMNQSSKIQFKASSGRLYNTTDLGSIKSVTLNSAAGGATTTYYGTTQKPTSGTSVGTGNGYFTIKAGSSYGTCSSITVAFTKSDYTYSDYCTTVKTTPTLSFSAPTAEVTIGADDNVFPTLTTTPADLAGVTYESSNTAVATINENTGAVLLVAPGRTTITATFEGDEDHNATSASYELVVAATLDITLVATDGDMYYATFSSEYAWVVPDDLEVSEVSVIDGALYIESYSTSDVVPANTGVLVSALEAGTYSVDVETDPETLELAESVLGEDNMLYPASKNKADLTNHKFYMLSYDSNRENLGFYYAKADGAAFTSREGTAYLAISESIGAPARFVFNSTNTATGVDTLENSEDAVKFMKDGQLFILRNGVLYNAIGQIVK